MYRLLQATSIVTMCILVCLTRLCSANITAHQLLPTTTTSTPKFPKQNVVKVPTPPPSYPFPFFKRTFYWNTPGFLWQCCPFPSSEIRRENQPTITQPRPQVFSVNVSITCSWLHFLTSFVQYGKTFDIIGSIWQLFFQTWSTAAGKFCVWF